MEQERGVAMSKATKRVLELFESTGMGVVPFERMLGLTEGTIKNLKNGRNNASADTICRAAEYFKVSVDYIVGYTDFPQCPTSWWILSRTLITSNKDIAFLSQETGLPLDVFSNWELGLEPNDNALQSICDALKLKVNPFNKAKKSVQIKRLDNGVPVESSGTYPIVFEELPELLKEQRFTDTAKLYNALPDQYRERVLGVVMGIAIGLGINTDKVLGRC